jgi:hypothetical protein
MNHPIITAFKDRLRASFLLRWTLANIAGWTVGLYLSALSFSTPVLCLGGALAGACVGAAQWYALRDDYPVGREWIAWSAGGGLVGMLPAAFAGVLVALGWGLGIALVGGIVGAAVGAAQWSILNRQMNGAGWWIVANLAAGAACALLTLAPIIWGLPIGLLVGTAIYGYVTGRVFIHLQSLKTDY